MIDCRRGCIVCRRPSRLYSCPRAVTHAHQHIGLPNQLFELPGVIWCLPTTSLSLGAVRITSCPQQLPPPPPSPLCFQVDFKNHHAYAKECEEGRRLGFAGKQIVHPAQIGIAHVSGGGMGRMAGRGAGGGHWLGVGRGRTTVYVVVWWWGSGGGAAACAAWALRVVRSHSKHKAVGCVPLHVYHACSRSLHTFKHGIQPLGMPLACLQAAHTPQPADVEEAEELCTA